MTSTRSTEVAHRAIIQRVVEALPQLKQDGDVAHLEVIGGLSNHVYRVQMRSGRSVIVRIPAEHSPIDRYHEMKCLNQAVTFGFAPEPLHIDPAEGILVMADYAGQFPSDAALREPAMLGKAARLLRSIHDAHLDFSPALDPWGKFDSYLACCGGVPAPLAQNWDLLCEFRRQWIAENDLVSCHGDPTPGNFLATGAETLNLIDWEYATQASRWWDIALFCDGLALTADQRTFFTEAYRVAPSAADIPLRQYRILAALISSAWGFARYAETNTDSYLLLAADNAGRAFSLMHQGFGAKIT